MYSELYLEPQRLCIAKRKNEAQKVNLKTAAGLWSSNQFNKNLYNGLNVYIYTCPFQRVQHSKYHQELFLTSSVNFCLLHFGVLHTWFSCQFWVKSGNRIDFSKEHSSDTITEIYAQETSKYTKQRLATYLSYENHLFWSSSSYRSYNRCIHLYSWKIKLQSKTNFTNKKLLKNNRR